MNGYMSLLILQHKFNCFIGIFSPAFLVKRKKSLKSLFSLLLFLLFFFVITHSLLSCFSNIRIIKSYQECVILIAPRWEIFRFQPAVDVFGILLQMECYTMQSTMMHMMAWHARHAWAEFCTKIFGK